MLAPPDQDLEVKEFDAGLRQFQSDAGSIGPLVDAWSHGDAALVGRLMTKELDKAPGAKNELIDNRNDAWIVQLDKMLGECGRALAGRGHEEHLVSAVGELGDVIAKQTPRGLQ